MMDKKKKLYVGLLCAAAAAFVSDRLLFNSEEIGPATATAALKARAHPPEAVKSAAGAGSLVKAAAAGTPGAHAGTALADRIDRVCGALGVDPLRAADAFSPSQAWRPRPVEAEVKAASPPEERLLEDLAGKYTVSALLSGPNGSAILNDRCIRVGQVLDGCTLVEVEGEAAIFESAGRRVTLRVPR